LLQKNINNIYHDHHHSQEEKKSFFYVFVIVGVHSKKKSGQTASKALYILGRGSRASSTFLGSKAVGRKNKAIKPG